MICADVKIGAFQCSICPRRHYGEELFQGKLKWWKMCAAWSVLGFVRTPARAIILCETAGQSLWDCGWLVTVCVSLCRSLCEWEPLLLSGCHSFQWRSKSLRVAQPANQACIIQSKEILALRKRTWMLKETEAALDHNAGAFFVTSGVNCVAGSWAEDAPVRSWRLWRHCISGSEACLAWNGLDTLHSAAGALWPGTYNPGCVQMQVKQIIL